MKKNIGNFDELLRTLAQKGDPAAFFSLTEPYFEARYQKERNNGSTEADAKDRILEEAANLLVLLQDIPEKQVDYWFKEHCTVAASSLNNNEKILPDKKMVMETNRFLNECSRKLLRTGSILKKNKQVESRKFPHTVLQNRFFLPAGICILVFIISLTILYLMHRSHASFTITFSSLNNHYSWQIPSEPPTDKPISQPDILPQKDDSAPAVLPSAIPPDTVNKNAETVMQIENRTLKKPVIQKKVSTIPMSVPEPRPGTAAIIPSHENYAPSSTPNPGNVETGSAAATIPPAPQPITAEAPSSTWEPPNDNVHSPAASFTDSSSGSEENGQSWP